MTSQGLSLLPSCTLGDRRAASPFYRRGLAQQSWGDSVRKEKWGPGLGMWLEATPESDRAQLFKAKAPLGLPRWSIARPAHHRSFKCTDLACGPVSQKQGRGAQHAQWNYTKHQGSLGSRPRAPQAPGFLTQGDGDASAQPATDAVLQRQPEHGPAWPGPPQPSVTKSSGTLPRASREHLDCSRGERAPRSTVFPASEARQPLARGLPTDPPSELDVGASREETKATEARLAPHSGPPWEPCPLQTVGGGVTPGWAQLPRHGHGCWLKP